MNSDDQESSTSTSATWYLSHAGSKEGPYSLEEAQQVVARKGDSLLCWTAGMDAWVSVKQHPAFSRNDNNAGPTRGVSPLLGVGIFFAPYVFCWWLLRSGHSTAARIIGFSWAVVGLMVIALYSEGGSRVELEEVAGRTWNCESMDGAKSSTLRISIESSGWRFQELSVHETSQSDHPKKRPSYRRGEYQFGAGRLRLDTLELGQEYYRMDDEAKDLWIRKNAGYLHDAGGIRWVVNEFTKSASFYSMNEFNKNDDGSYRVRRKYFAIDHAGLKTPDFQWHEYKCIATPYRAL